MLHIIANPSIYNALLSELWQASKNGALSSPVRDCEAQQLPYLQAVICEGLRIFPPIAHYLPKVSPPGGDTINGTHFPGGTEVGFATYAMMRQRHIFGNDADIFRPERFLEATPEATAEMKKVQTLVFHSGKWTCLGKNIAYMELNKIFIGILRSFDVAIVDPTRAWTHINWGLPVNREMYVKFTERSEKF
jgi:cytochrome P450